MKTALITTTINVPRVLSLYRKLDPDVRFFVACDLKTPPEAYDFCKSIPNCEVYSPDRQKELGYECSPLLGWNTIGRRNIALLEALRWGADVIVTIDDDNMGTSDFSWFRMLLSPSGIHFNGVEATSSSGWFDVGTLLDPVAPHRGFPHTKTAPPILSPVTDAKIGVAAGICLGDPDISAITRIANAPTVHRVSELLRAGVVTDPRHTYTVFNSQNTAFIRELAPCFLMVPQFGRYDDIFASLVAQRVMREKNFHVHFGQPMVVQQRNQHDLLKDLKAEMWGMEHVLEFANHLDGFVFQRDALTEDMVRMIYNSLWANENLPEGTGRLALAWLDDIEKLLG